jgi:UDP:flavonoid glycosyltransferase YjiC (YdhE family)
MNVGNINKPARRLRILVAPLDWGLGHATRCIPVIRALVARNADVVLAAEGSVVVLLQHEFPQLKIINLPGYRIRYSRHKRSFSFKLLLQVPRMFSVIRQENKWLKKAVALEKIDAVISDNRFGLHHPTVPCIYITHQLCIQTGNRTLNRMVQAIHYRYINKFTACWVPDNEGNINLAGNLSHPASFPKIPVRYTGILSRFRKAAAEKKYDFLLLLSGPEPQRTMLEDILLNQFKHSAYSFALVRGLPGNDTQTPDNGNSAVFNHLGAAELETLIRSSETVIARAGYSTIMDLATLDKDAILIPTPGQTEQEYLAAYLAAQGLFFSVEQDDFSQETLDKGRYKLLKRTGLNTTFNEQVIADWLNNLTDVTYQK